MQVFTERKYSTSLDPESQSEAKQATTAALKDSTHLESQSGANPPANLGILKEQVLDENLLRLWRTESHYEQYLPEEDGEVDVSYCLLYTHACLVCIIF